MSLVFLLCYGMSLVAFLPQFKRPTCINDDVRQHTFWMEQYKDPGLFPNNPYVAYSQYYSTPLFKWLYRVLVHLGNPLSVGKWLGVILFGISGLLFFAMGRKLGGDGFGVLCVLSFLSIPFIYLPFSGGLQRAFGIPLLASFVALCLHKKYQWGGLLLALSLSLYPVSAALSGGALAVSLWLFPWKPNLKEKMFFAGGLAVFLVTLILMLLDRSVHRPDFIGAMLTRSEMMIDPAFSETGRFIYTDSHTPSFFVAWMDFFFKDRFSMAAFLGGVILLGWAGRAHGKWILSEAGPILALLGILPVLYYAADYFFPSLFIPVRYLTYVLYVIVPLFMAVFFYGVALSFERSGFGARAWAAVVCVMVVMGFFNARSAAEKGQIAINYGSQPFLELKNFFHDSPKDVLIAADPYVSDNIMTFVRRNTFLTYELSHPWNRDYRVLFESRTRDYFRVMFSADPEKIRSFCSESGVRYMVLSKRFYESRSLGWQSYFFDPVNTELNEELMGRDPQASYLYRLNGPARIFENDGFVVFDAKLI